VEPEAIIAMEKIQMGFRFIAFGTDFYFMRNNSKDQMSKILKSIS